MGKGGSDLMIAGQLQALMVNHPYNPEVRGEDTPWPYLLSNAIQELYPKLSNDELARVLFHTFDKVYLAGGTMTVDQALAQLARKVMLIFAKRDETLMALNAHRERLYESLRWPSTAEVSAE